MDTKNINQNQSTKLQQTDIPQDTNQMSYEQAFDQLQQINRRIEQGSIPLSEISKSVERSRQLYNHCNKYLNELKLVIEKLEQDQNYEE